MGVNKRREMDKMVEEIKYLKGKLEQARIRYKQTLPRAFRLMSKRTIKMFFCFVRI